MAFSEKFEQVSDIIGPWGKFQKRLFFLMIFVYIFSPFNNVGLVYYMTKADFWCTSTNGIMTNGTINQCYSNGTRTCDRWFHNTTRLSLIKEWDLICDRSALGSLALSAYQMGYMFSGIIIGHISDNYGRKTALIVSILIEIVSGFGITLSPSIYVFIVVRFIHGIAGFGRYLSSLLIMVENVGPDYRGKVVVAYDWIWHGGQFLMMLATYFIDSFRTLYLGVTLFQILALLLCITYIPESVRWQLVMKKTAQARKTLEKYIDMSSEEDEILFNERLNELSQFLSKQTECSQSTSLLDIWCVGRLLRYCLTLYSLWISIAFMCYSMEYFTLDLSGNYFLNSAIIKVANIAATAFLTWRVEKFSRRSLLLTSMIVLMISMFTLIPIAIDHHYIIYRNCIIAIAAFFIGIAFSMVYVYTSEVFPTTIRHIAVGSCSTAARIGSISAPFVNELTRETNIRVTMILLGVLSASGALAVLALPETKGREIPDTVDEMIEMIAGKFENDTDQEGIVETLYFLSCVLVNICSQSRVGDNFGVSVIMVQNMNDVPEAQVASKVQSVTDVIGSWGNFQFRVLLIMLLIYLCSALNNSGMEAYMKRSEFYCQKANGSELASDSSMDQCDAYSQKCELWAYNTTRTSVVKEWNLVCDKSWLATATLSVYQFGYLVSGIVMGFFSDRFGRKTAAVTSMSLEVLCGFAITFSPSITSLIIIRFFHGLAGYGRYLSTLLILVESVGPSHRGTIVVGYEWVWHGGQYVMLLLAYFVEDFRTYFAITSFYEIFALAILITQIPESIRWLLATGQTELARKTVEKYYLTKSKDGQTELNQKLDQLSEYLIEQGKVSEDTSLIQIWRNPRLRKYCLALYILWLVTAFQAYGMDYLTLDLTGNYFSNKALIKLAAVIATIILTFQIERFNRRTLFFVSYVAIALAMFSVALVGNNTNLIYLRNAILMFGQFFVVITFAMAYVYSSELYPTKIRHLAVGSCSTAGRVGSMLSPLINQLTRLTDIWITMTVFAFLPIIGCLTLLVLPETRGKNIPDTMKEMVEFTESDVKKSSPENVEQSIN
ncbi:uncharacterized protein LOC141851688 [Brevipalpus obovatus]|uniref:uncharacterized protein LOC141851688 n=1 Tax=Brevipalpus obovatus TaxID=246614 RepID=UPI003D9DE9AF